MTETLRAKNSPGAGKVETPEEVETPGRRGRGVRSMHHMH